MRFRGTSAGQKDDDAEEGFSARAAHPVADPSLRPFIGEQLPRNKVRVETLV